MPNRELQKPTLVTLLRPPPETGAPLRIRFGRHLLDEAEGALYRDGEPVEIEPKPLAVLTLLARRRPHLVSFAEIQHGIWPDVTVQRSARDRAISQARSAVDDDGRSQHTIATRRGRGLCFVAEATEVGAEDLPRAAAVAVDRLPLVGREVELARLEESVAAAAAGEGGVAWIEGEAGVGKTRLAREVASRARERGMAVHWVRAAPERDEAEPLSLSRRTLRQILGAERERPALPVFAHLKPLLAALEGEVFAKEATVSDAVHARARWEDAMERFLATDAMQIPRLFVLDDYQWSDRETLRIARRVMPQLTEVPCLMLVIWREEGELSEEAAALLRRVVPIARCHVPLRGLRAPAIAALLEAATGAVPSPETVDALALRSDGNAFFVTELARLWVDRAQTAGVAVSELEPEIPPTITQVLDERLSRLSPECVGLLKLAARVGRDVDLDVLALASGRGRESVSQGVQEAIRAGLMQARDDSGRSVRFTHWLMTEQLARQGEPQHERWHWAVAEALESLFGDGPERWTEIARHRARGLGAGDPDTVLRAALRAAERADRTHAYEELASLLEDARRAQALLPGTTPLDRGELALRHGRACLRAGRRADARRCFEAAATSARRYDLPELLARAALGFAKTSASFRDDQKAERELVVAALGRLDESEGSLRARLLAALSAIRAIEGDNAAAEGLAGQAVVLARRLGDDATLASVLRSRDTVLLRNVLRADERIEHADESFAFAHCIGDVQLALGARVCRGAALLHRGDTLGFRRELSHFRRHTQDPRYPLMRFFAELAEVTGQVLDGHLDAAERTAEAAQRIGQQLEHADSARYFSQQIDQLRLLQGRLGEMIEPLSEAAVASDGTGIHATLAIAEACVGRRYDALRRTRSLVDLLSAAPRDVGWLNSATRTALAAVRLEDIESAERLAAMLDPYAGHSVATFVITYGGSVAYYLGELARVRGRNAEAAAHLASAREVHTDGGCQPWLLLTQLAQARLLARSRREADRIRGLQTARAILAHPTVSQMAEVRREAGALAELFSDRGRDLDPSD